MAAGGFGNVFEPDFQLKRKRRLDDSDDLSDKQDLFLAKRRNITQLPIRSPPRPSIAVTPAFGQFTLHPGTLTPDSIPEDDVFQSNSEHGKRLVDYRAHDDPNASSTDSITAQADSNSADHDDTEMQLSSPKQTNRQIPTPIRVGRARSNDLMSPVRSPIHIPPSPSRWSHDRMPTPVASRFPMHSPFESSFASAATRQLRPHILQTTLSPMTDAESWTPQIQRPPSPGPENDLESAFNSDADAVMQMDDSNSNMMSSSFSELSVHSSDVHSNSFTSTHGDYQSINQNSHSPPARNRLGQPSWTSSNAHNQLHRGLGLDGTDRATSEDTYGEGHTMETRKVGHGHGRNQSGTGRTGRLHMGFLAGCERCVARVPGHYSHIIWS